jgi:hypothetical protein
MEARESDIQKLCLAVLNANANHYDNPNGGYESTCPFCDKTISKGGGKNGEFVDIDEINHELDCAYLIAKDLSTNYKSTN